MNDTPKDREPVRRVPAEPPQPYVSQNVAPKNDIFPYLMGALIAALVVGIGVLIFVLGRPNSAVTPSVPTPITNFPTEVPTSPSNAIPPAQPTNGTGTSTGTGNPTVPSGAPPVLTVQPTIPPGSSDADVPRMSMEDFKALYDDPAKRPIIIDVRTASGYDAGHIKGAISFPEEQIATLVSQLPKDKLVVAYCSWPAENSSARVALKLHTDYGYSFENLKVLQGGWGLWEERSKQDAQGYPIETK